MQYQSGTVRCQNTCPWGAGTGTAAGAADHLWGRLVKDHLKAAGLPTLLERRLLLCKDFYKKRILKSDNKLNHLLPTPRDRKYSLRHTRRLPKISGRTRRFRNSFVPRAVRVFDWPLKFSCMGSDSMCLEVTVNGFNAWLSGRLILSKRLFFSKQLRCLYRFQLSGCY